MLSGMVAVGVYRNQYTGNRPSETCSRETCMTIFLFCVIFTLFVLFLFFLQIEQ